MENLQLRTERILRFEFQKTVIFGLGNFKFSQISNKVLLVAPNRSTFLS